jgi:hypothetical protein
MTLTLQGQLIKTFEHIYENFFGMNRQNQRFYGNINPKYW